MARILIVDDEDNVQFVLAQALRKQGHEILTARDGDDALRTLSSEKVDLVVTDLIMPNREGLETIQDIRLNWPDVKIVAMSGGGRSRNTKILALARKLGAHTILKKPFPMAEIVRTVDMLLERTDSEGDGRKP